jgi:hypothetical protein
MTAAIDAITAAKLRTLLKDGTDLTEAAREVGVAYKTCRRYARRWRIGSTPNIGGQRQRWSPDEDATLRRLYQDKITPEDIAAALGRSVPAIEARRRLIGLSDYAPRPEPEPEPIRPNPVTAQCDLYAIWLSAMGARRTADVGAIRAAGAGVPA